MLVLAMQFSRNRGAGSSSGAAGQDEPGAPRPIGGRGQKLARPPLRWPGRTPSEQKRGTRLRVIN
jgi:hypothetical protein